jgi:galacturan 1,4-alpha-galacturonidase
MSVGSLGQYPGEVDIVEHVYVYNTTMRSSSDGARIKVWAGAPSDPTNLGGSGGGSGRVHNITYEHFVNEGNDRKFTIILSQ